jgi:ParB family transcriptional regulator, chromosome partitioning protein
MSQSPETIPAPSPEALVHIPLHRLRTSRVNVRRIDRKADVDALAASIRAHGLLQNLTVADAGHGRFTVLAGARRHAALKLLATSGAIPKGYCVPCRVVDARQGVEASLAENVHRRAMHPLDEADAFQALGAQGLEPRQIAERFGVPERHVAQRLGLAGLSPRLKTAWKRGELSLEAAKAFCLVDDHARQEAVLRSLARPVTDGASVRARLMDGRLPADHPLVRLVGMAAYEAAGGKVTRDLFGTEEGYIEDRTLLTELAEQHVLPRREALVREGWGWAELHLGLGRGEWGYPMRVHPDRRALTPEESSAVDRLQGELEELDAALDRDSTENDPRWDQRDDLAGAIEEVRQQAREWDRELIAHAGVVIAINASGEPVETMGLVRSSDEKFIRAVRKRRETLAAVDARTSTEEPYAAPSLTSRSCLPKALVRDLSSARSAALRRAVAADPEIALAVAVATIVLRLSRGVGLTGVGLVAHFVRDEGAQIIPDEIEAWFEGGMGDDLSVLEVCLKQPAAKLLGALASLVAGVIDLSHETGTAHDDARRALADRLATAVNLDMSNSWTADLAYWMRLPKAELLLALRDAPSVVDAPAEEQASIIASHARLPKADLAARLDTAYARSTYLPDLLVTQPSAGGFEITLAGEGILAQEERG